MQRYGQIYVLCVTTVRLICLFMRKLGLIFSQMRVGRFSHKCFLADFLTRAIEQLSFPKTADGAVGQFMSGEQVSFCLTISIINHLDVFTK